MCHPLTPREATQAPVAMAALAKVSSTTADMYPCLPSFHFDTASATSIHNAAVQNFMVQSAQTPL